MAASQSASASPPSRFCVRCPISRRGSRAFGEFVTEFLKVGQKPDTSSGRERG